MADRAVARVELDGTAKAKIASGVNTVFTNNKKTAHAGSITTKGHAVVQGATTVFVENKPIARAGDLVAGEGAILQGSLNVFASDIIAAKVDSVAVGSVASQTSRYIKNPNSFHNQSAEDNYVKPNYNPAVYAVTENTDETRAPVPSAIDLIPWLTARLAEAALGQWRETGQGGKPSNSKITNIWTELGFPRSAPWNTDQTAWCMGFVNYALKSCGYRWAAEAGSVSIQNKPSRWNATRIAIKDAQPGDIALWSFHHVNFVYTVEDGKYTFVGGNQTPTSGKRNNPNDGDLTVSWPSGWTTSRGGIVGIWRPSKS